MSQEKRLTAKKGTKTRAMKKARSKMRRNRMLRKIGKLGILGLTTSAITIGGYTLYDAHKFNKELDNFDKQIEKIDKEKSERDLFVEGLKVENVQAKTDSEKSIEDIIIEQYNSEVLPEEQISKEDIGYIKEEHFNDASIYKSENENGKEIYIQNHLDGMTEQGLDWVEAKDIDGVIAVVNKKDLTVITAEGIINDEYVPVEVQALTMDANTTYSASENYITLEGNSKENYEKLLKGYERYEKEIQEKEDKGMELE